MEEVVIRNLLFNEEFYTKVFSFIKPKHFEKVENAEIIRNMKEYVKKYDEKPNAKELVLFIKNSNDIKENLKKEILRQIKAIIKDQNVENMEFLLEETEKWIQRQELSEAIFKSADIIQNDEEFEPIIGMIEEALSISFDTDVGLSYNDEESVKDRYEYYNSRTFGETIGIPSVDKSLGGGIKPRTLNVVVAPSHGGKTALLISAATHAYLKGKNVLFFSLEMPDIEIARRVDACILHYPANDLDKYPKEEFFNKMTEIQEYAGNLVIKDYPAGYFNVLVMKSLLNDLKTKDNFTPDLIVIDYITLMSSTRTTLSKAGGYSFFKSIAEELHGFAKNENLPILTAAQLNRSGYNTLEAGMDTIADSLGVIQTADNVIAILSTDQLREENQAVIKILKNRNTGRLNSHLIRVDFDTISFTDMDDTDKSIESINAQIQATTQQINSKKLSEVINFD